MSTDFEKLLAEADIFTDGWDIGKDIGDALALIETLATALREAARYVPPEGWVATTLTHKDSGALVEVSHHKGRDGWVAVIDARVVRHGDRVALFPTAREAIAAIETEAGR